MSHTIPPKTEMTTQRGKDIARVRELAREVAELANSQENDVIIKRWCDCNAKRKIDRAPIWVKPVACWPELIPEDVYECIDPALRQMESAFLQLLKKRDIGDDEPLKKYFPVQTRLIFTPENVLGVDVHHESSGVEGGAWAYVPPIESDSDLDKLVMPTIAYDKESTDRALADAEELLGDILPVKRVCTWSIHRRLLVTLGMNAAELVGLTNLLMNLAVAPEMMHRLMAHLRDVTLSAMDWIEESGLLTPNNEGGMYQSDPLGELVEGKATLKNCWDSPNSQEFDQVSPPMWEEFLLNYQRPIIERMGAISYGCCENLTHKLDGVLSLPNLRIVTCSAWSDLDTVIDKVGTKHVIMWREKATDICFPDDTVSIKAKIEDHFKRLQGCHYQIILRELQTLCGHQKRLHEWVDIAKEAAFKYAT
jgi:hypothetical protein